MNLLFLTEICPFPPNGGEKLRSYGLLKLMSGLNHTVHAITGNSPVNNPVDNEFKGIRFYPYKFCYNYDSYKTSNRIKWYLRLFTCEKELILLINSILDQNQIEVAFIDYLFYGQYIKVFRKRNIPVIYGTHNAQAELINQIPVETFRGRRSRFIQYVTNKLHEIVYFRKANALIVVSENDKKYHQTFVKKERIYIIPNFLDEFDYKNISRQKENYILMTANFSAFQNAYGLEWFVREVWDEDLWQRTRLLLLGTYSNEVFNNLKGKYNLTGIKATGMVDDLKPYISNALVSIVPLLHGSGSRLKCLESMALKTQLLSTSKGAEGIDHNNSILIADSPAEFKKALLNTLDGKTDLTEKAYRAFMDKYSLPPNKAIFTEILLNITGAGK
jgi:glycosyltransferase involved in cell wall biosynthesis